MHLWAYLFFLSTAFLVRSVKKLHSLAIYYTRFFP